MAGTIAPIQEITPDSHGAVATVTCLVSIITFVFVVGARVWITLKRKLGFQSEDMLFMVAAVLAISQSACVIKQVDVGLGRHWETLSPRDSIAFLKISYSVQLLATVAMGCAKVSVPLLYQRIVAPVEPQYYYIYFILMAAGWTVFSIFAQAFACQLPKPWLRLPSDCLTQFSLEYVVITLNIVTDAVLALAFLPHFWKLNVNRRKRIILMTLFASRLVVSAAGLAQLVVLIQTPKNSDVSWEMLLVTIMDQVVISLSVISACLPRIHHFLYNLQTGQLGAIIPENEITTHPTDNDTKFTAQQNPSNSDNNESPNLFKPKRASRPSGGAIPPTMSHSGSQSSLFHGPQSSTHKKSHDTTTNCSSVTAEEIQEAASFQPFRPLSEPLSSYSMRCFSDADGGRAGNNNILHREQRGLDNRLSNNIVYETREFEIKYLKTEGKQ